MLLTNKKVLLPAAILLTATAIAAVLFLTRPEPKLAAITIKPLLINAAKVVKQDLKISVQAQGTINPRTSTTLVAEVAGSITHVSPKFKVGGFFKKDEVLLQIDQRDYLTKVKQSEAVIASAKSNLALEKGRAEVAYQDWLKYKSDVIRSKTATQLALRKPQQLDAQAKLDAAIADHDHARNELERTTIRAPYDGLVRAKQVDIGQYVNAGSTLAQTFAIDVAELRLAIPESKLNYLQLPHVTSDDNTNHPSVDLYAHIGDQRYQWKANLVRTEGVLDERSRVLFVVAQINDPYGLKSPQQQTLRIGTFVNATIEGKTIPHLVKLPRHILRAGNRVWIIDAENRLQDRQVSILQTQGDDMYVTSGLAEGELVCLSNISATIAGTQVRISSTVSSDTSSDTPDLPGPSNEDKITPELAPASQAFPMKDKHVLKKTIEDQSA